MMLINANALTIPLADESVQCVVTSPPYWGLRDYGTAEWVGGDDGCDHLEGVRFSNKSGIRDTSRQSTIIENKGKGKPYKDICGKCGAIRVDAQLGLEPTPEQYIENMVAVFREVRRVMRDDATLWLNMGDSYATQQAGNTTWGDGVGSNKYYQDENDTRGLPKRYIPSYLKPKDLVGIPWRLALALQADGWWLRSDIIWHKPNPMPESVTDRPTKAHEYVFLLTKSKTYFYDADSIREPHATKLHAPGNIFHEDKIKGPMSRDGHSQWERDMTKTWGNPAGSNRRTVWTIATAPYSGAHFATFPPKLVEPCIKAGTSEHGCCPECGAPWERVVLRLDKRHWTERNEYTKSKYQLGDNESGRNDGRADFTIPEFSTQGWGPSCNHYETDPIPCTVFDPFAGSGTTLMVARALGRKGIGTDLSMDYLKLARERLLLDKLEEWGDGLKLVETKKQTEGLPMFEVTTGDCPRKDLE